MADSTVERAAVKPQATIGGDALSGRRILIVEDETLVCMMIEDMLADLGCAVAGCATNLEQALPLASEAAFDVAILDVNLNGKRSFPIADRLAERGLPFVFATGYGTEMLSEAYADTPMLKKPFQQRDLAQALAKALSRG